MSTTTRPTTGRDPAAEAAVLAAEACISRIDRLAPHRAMIGADVLGKLRSSSMRMLPTAESARSAVGAQLTNDQVPRLGRVRTATETVDAARTKIESDRKTADALTTIARAAVIVNAIPPMPKDADAAQARAEFDMIAAAHGALTAVPRMAQGTDQRLQFLALGTYGKTVLETAADSAAHADDLHSKIVLAAIHGAGPQHPARLAAGAAALDALDKIPAAVDGLNVLANIELGYAESEIRTAAAG